MTTNSIFFDSDDINYLVFNLETKQLKAEIHSAEMRSWTAEYFQGTPYTTSIDSWPWADYANACRLALDIRRWIDTLVPVKSQMNSKKRIDVEALKMRIDIVDEIGKYVELRKSGRYFTALCPFHNEKTASFFVFPESQSWHCFGACNAGGDVIDFVMKIQNCDFRVAAEILNK